MNNNLMKVPGCIGSLSSLVILELANNKIRNLPLEISKLTFVFNSFYHLKSNRLLLIFI